MKTVSIKVRKIYQARPALCIIALLLTLTTYSSVGFAQTEKESAAPKKTEQEASEKADSQIPKAPTKSSSSKTSGSDFTPSEEVSEDLSVSFPVDI